MLLGKWEQTNSMLTLVKRTGKHFRKKLRTLRHRYIDNFIFIHINKTGGSSIEKVLKLNLEHKTALRKIEEIGYEHWKKKFTFAVVRNPWDKVVSHYHYRVQTDQTNLGTSPVGFTDWVRLSYGQKDPLYYDKPIMFMPQSDWVSDHDGKILINFVCHFENLNDDFSYVAKELGISVNLPHLKSSKHGHYSDCYNEESRDIVANWFKKDIENFGYSF